jgi:hypothetical protein
MTIVSGDGQTMVTQRRAGNQSGFTTVNAPAALAWEPGPNYPNDGPDDTGWEANSLWDQRLSTDLRPTGADWIWEDYRVLDPVYGTALTLQRSFDIGAPIAGNLKIACDNGYEVFLNGTSLGSDNVYGDWRTSNLKQAFVDVNGWDTVGSFDLLDYLLAGANDLTVDAANEYFNTDDSGNGAPGTMSSNPGACIFAMDLSYYADGETAWGCGNDSSEPNCENFDGKNWATYFVYTVQCAVDPGLVNGGFETPVVNTSQGWDIYDSETEGLGWMVEWYDGSTSYGGQTRPEPAHLELHQSGTIVTTPDGGQYAELDTDWDGPGGGLNGEPASVKIYQVLDTCPDQEYTLTYAWRGRPGYISKLQVNFADYSYSHSDSSGQWNVVEVTAIATDWTTTLEFIETGPADSFGMFLDAVSVTKCDTCSGP